METNFSDACIGCASRPVCDARIDRMSELEDRAERAGKLITEGSVVCELGPRPVRIRHIDDNECRAAAVLPTIQDPVMAAEAQRLWPKASPPKFIGESVLAEGLQDLQ